MNSRLKTIKETGNIFVARKHITERYDIDLNTPLGRRKSFRITALYAIDL